MAKQGAASAPARAQMRGEAVRLAQQGQLDKAAALCRQLMQADAADADTPALLAAVLNQLGQSVEAAEAAGRALKLRPTHAMAAFNLGNAMLRLERLEEAEQAFRQAATAQPNDPDILCNLAALLQRRGAAAEAVSLCRRGLGARPNDANLLSNLGNALTVLGETASAAEAYRKVTMLTPQDADAWRDLSAALERLWRLDEAIRANERALALRPGDPLLRAELLYQYQHACDWPRQARMAAEVDRDIDAALARGETVSESPLSNVGRCDDPARNALLARNWARVPERSAARLPAASAPAAKPRLKVGYLSADFRDHAIGHLTCGLYRAHDRAAVEVHCFSYGRDNGGGYRDAIRAGTDHFIDVMAMGDAEAARAIRAAGIDIVVDLMGWTTNQRLAICAARPAPLQATFLGFPGTTGASFFDYAIVDRIVVPPEHAMHWSERLVFLPQAYQVNNRAQAIAASGASRASVGLPEDAFVFASFNQPFKIGEATFRAWTSILGAVPGSVLWLMQQNDLAVVQLRRAAEAAGIAAGRLVFAPPLPKPLHLERLALADLALDTLIYNGHTTTSDCLWAGLPVVAVRGRHFASRVSASLLQAIGLPELVAEDVDGYRRLAVALAHERARLDEIRRRLAANRLTAPLFDTELFARNLERAYRLMWDRAVAGLSPATIEVD